jgi:hypothetical protein
MAFYSPSAKDMQYFKKILASKTGKIDTKALGEFVIKQSNNKKVDLCFKHTKNGDVFQVFEIANPKNSVTVPCNTVETAIKKGDSIFKRIKSLFFNKKENFEYDPVGSWDNLPESLKKAGEIANKMEMALK